MSPVSSSSKQLSQRLALLPFRRPREDGVSEGVSHTTDFGTLSIGEGGAKFACDRWLKCDISLSQLGAHTRVAMTRGKQGIDQCIFSFVGKLRAGDVVDDPFDSADASLVCGRFLVGARSASK